MTGARIDRRLFVDTFADGFNKNVIIRNSIIIIGKRIKAYFMKIDRF